MGHPARAAAPQPRRPRRPRPHRPAAHRPPHRPPPVRRDRAPAAARAAAPLCSGTAGRGEGRSGGRPRDPAHRPRSPGADRRTARLRRPRRAAARRAAQGRQRACGPGRRRQCIECAGCSRCAPPGRAACAPSASARARPGPRCTALSASGAHRRCRALPRECTTSRGWLCSRERVLAHIPESEPEPNLVNRATG